MEVDPVLRRTVNCECEEEGTLPLLPTPKRKTALLPTPAKGRKTLLSKSLTMTHNFEFRTIIKSDIKQIEFTTAALYSIINYRVTLETHLATINNALNRAIMNPIGFILTGNQLGSARVGSNPTGRAIVIFDALGPALLV